MANKVVVSKRTDELQHFGVLGMRWGVIRATSKSRKLTKKVTKTVKKFNKGKNPETVKISKKVRVQKYRMDKAIRKAEKFLLKNKMANADKVINRFNRDPAKKKVVEGYLKAVKAESMLLSELRMQLIDIRI